jgi:stage II sporulation protein D
MCSLFVLFPLIIVVIPMILVDFKEVGVKADAFSPINSTSSSDDSQIYINVKLSDEKKTIRIPLEDYIFGVVASEMPAEFEPQSLRAQAMAARTYIYSRVKNKEATVTDTVKDQVYATNEKLKEKWGGHFQQNMTKVQAAINSTKGKIITYQNKPIYAAFFSTSNGYTENSEEYFKDSYPYLRSVASTWDKASPKFMRSKTLSVGTLVKKLEEHTGKKVAVTAFEQKNSMKILKRTSGKRVSLVKVGDHIFTGREVREALGLASSDFSWKQRGDQITFATYGFGHGVGMSQWGANLMAKKGKTAEQIITHYYQRVKIKNIIN